jgi:hypothetical protein
VATEHAPTALVAPVRLARLLHQSRQTDWRDLKGSDLKKKRFAEFISRIMIKKGQNRKKILNCPALLSPLVE